MRTRVSEIESAKLARCSGFDNRGGHLVPEKGVSKTNTGTALSGTTPEQVPFAFVRDGSTRIIARDSAEAMRELIGGVWSSAGSVADILPESVPVRMGEQVIFATGGADPKIMAYEPGAPDGGTKLRPLSLKAPTDYATGTKPTVTPSATTSTHTRLFDCEDANAWASPGTGCTEVNTGTDVAVLSLDNTSVANTQCFTKSLAATPIDLTGKCFLVIDLMIANDPQAYSVDGLFVNDAGMQPSGYILALYSDAGCTTPITGASFHIPKLTPLGKVNRVAFNLGTQTATCQGIAILTETFYQPPTDASVSYDISVYSEDFLDDWGQKGNFVLPAVKWNKSPWAAKLTQLLNAGQSQMVDLPAGANLVTNPGFETGSGWGEGATVTGWTLAGGASRKADGDEGWPARNDGACIEIDNYGAGDNERIYRTSGSYIPVEAGREYSVGCYYLNPANIQSEWRMTVQPKNGISGTDVGSAFAFPSASTWYSEGKSEEYRLKIEGFTCPTGATHCDLKLEVKGSADGGVTYDNFRIDDVFLYATNQAMSGSAIVLQKFSTSGADREPGNPKVRYAYCFGGKDLLGVSDELWKLMVSNPSGWATDDAAAFADPWRTYAVAITLPSGPITAVSITAAGTGYTVNDVLALNEGTDGKVKVLTITGGGATGPVGTVEILKAGTGYSTGTKATTGGTGTGCTINVTAAATAITEYADYLDWLLVYRQLYDAESQTWYADFEGKRYLSSWGYANYVAIGATATYTDSGTDAIPFIEDTPVPKFMEITNGYAAPARHVMYDAGRVYALGANWDNENERWQAPTAIQASSYQKSWAFPTTPDPKKNDGLDGMWLDGYAVGGAEGRGLVLWRGEKYVFLDNEFFLMRGDNSQQGWRFTWIDSVGLNSARSVAGGRRVLMWHDGHHFQASTGGASIGISRYLIDSDAIDWTEPHGAVHFDEQYVFVGKLTSGDYVRMVYDLTRFPEPGWRTRYSDALQVVGITTDGQDIYGVTPTGDVVNIFGSLTTDYGAASVLREVWTQFLKTSGPSADAHVGRVLFDIITEEVAGIDLDLVVNWQGAKDGTQSIDLDPNSATTRYDVEMNGNGDAFQMKLSYTGTTAPDIYSMAVERDDVAAVL